MPLKILYAGYGIAGNMKDVTAKVQADVDQCLGSRAYTARGLDVVFGDPVPYHVKIFFVAWDKDGEIGSNFLWQNNENGHLILPRKT